mgnify:FL=1
MSSEYSSTEIAQFMNDYQALYESVRQLRCETSPKRDLWGTPIENSIENKYLKIGIANNILNVLIPKIPFEFLEYLDIDISALEKECSEILELQLSAV